MNSIEDKIKDIEAERSIIYCILSNNESISNIIDDLKPDFFYNYKNKIIYEAMVLLFNESSKIDLITLFSKLESLDNGNTIERTYTSEILSDMSSSFVSPLNIKSYANKVAEKSKLRDILKLQDLIAKWCSQQPNPDEILKAIDVSSNKITEKYRKHEKLEIDNNKVYTWGTPYLDKHITAIKPHKHIVLVGETGSGKTTFCFDTAIKNAEQGKRVMFISLEMPKEEIYKVKSEDYAGITMEEYRENSWSDEKEAKLRERYDYLKKLDNLRLVGFGGDDKIEVTKIMSFIRQSNHKDLVFIDNLDLIECSGTRTDLERVETVSKTFMNFSKEFNIPTILLHHYKKGTSGSSTSSSRGIDSVRGSAKVTHNAHMVLKVERESGDSQIQNAALTIVMMKDRRFGKTAVCTIFWGNGTFLDKNEYITECTEYGKFDLTKYKE